MPDSWSSPRLRLLVGGACLVVILWGISRASHLVVLILLGILLACSFLPLIDWLMQRFKLGKNAAVALTVVLLGTLSLVTVFSLYERIFRLRAALPVYQQRFMVLYESVLVFLNSHGINIASISGAKLATSDRILELSRVVIPEAASFLSDGLLVSLLALIFVIAMVEQPGVERSLLGERLRYYGEDVECYIGISAKVNVIAALANLVLFLVLGVEFPIVWCALSFFLRFIPSLGFIIALLPPTLVTLLVFGWKRALLVAGGFILINLVADYALTPIFMKKGADISFLEMTLSLVFWGTLLGPAGGILAIPLTMTLRKFIEEQSHNGVLARTLSG
jgi:AI-2 transport protein TqsA